MYVSALLRYPVKSGRGESVTEVSITPEGLEGDRRFMVARADGSYLTQREIPQLATLEARMIADRSRSRDARQLELKFPTRSINITVRTEGAPFAATLFGDRVSLIDQGPEVAAWLSAYLPVTEGPFSQLQRAVFGAPYRLLHAPDATTARSPRIRRPPPPLRGGAGLSDLAPLLLICEESLQELNARRALEGRDTVPMSRFRPNIVLSGCGKPHAEDSWTRLTIGSSAEFRITGPCPRCTVPEVGQQSGVRDAPGSGPMSTLRGYRSRAGAGVIFGVYLTPLNPAGARIRVGEQALVEAQ